MRGEPGQAPVSATAGTTQHADAAEHATTRTPAWPATSKQPGKHVGRRAQPQLQQQRQLDQQPQHGRAQRTQSKHGREFEPVAEHEGRTECMTFCPVGLRNSTEQTHVANFLMNPRTRGERASHELASPVVEFSSVTKQ